ncbi:MAG TPA: hypothetical protein VMX16_04970, partial [Terriglobia bacterium]|nr:hypothetical protein [Terriglobia bacterium]
KPPKAGNGKGVLAEFDPQGFKICLHLDTWEKHIIIGHPEMRDKLDLIAKTICEPEIIQQSPSVPTTYFYYRMTGRTQYRRNDLYVIVVVHRDESTKTGFIKTAHLVDKLHRGENIVWFKRT